MQYTDHEQYIVQKMSGVQYNVRRPSIVFIVKNSDSVTFTEEIRNRKFFLCAVILTKK